MPTQTSSCARSQETTRAKLLLVPTCSGAFELGAEEIVTCEAIVSEIVDVLSPRATNGLNHGDIRARLASFIRLRGLRLPGKHLYFEALDLYAAEPALDFEDARCIAHMRQSNVDEILSYDKDFDRIRGISRIEP